MKKIAIIPARVGSKRIPKKNIKHFLGKPIISYSIETALKSNLFDEVMVSTDDSEIAEVAIKYGAKVPFLRSQKNSDDFSGTGDVVYEVLNNYKKSGVNFKIACCLYATAPLIKSSHLVKAYNLLIKGKFDMTFPAVKYGASIWRSFKIDNKGDLHLNFPEFYSQRSQDLPNSFFDAGQFYWFYTSNFEKISNKNIFGSNKGAIILNEFQVQDIDEPSDWKYAELKYNYAIKEKFDVEEN